MNVFRSGSRFFLLMLLVLLMVNVEAVASPSASQKMTESQMPKGLWQAFSEARHAVELSKEKKEGYIYKAYNPKNHYGIRYGEQGLKLLNSDWEFGMSLQAYGQESTLTPVSKATLHAKGNKVTYDRGNISEWYINDTQGLEQGFTLNKPNGYDANKELILSFDLKGELTSKWKTKGESLSFYKKNIKAFDYEKLKAFDAKGKTLPSRLALKENYLQIVVDTKEAQWPVTVDPIFSTEQKVVGVTSDVAAGDWLGKSVALNGNTAVIGAPREDDGGTDSGSAYVLVRTAAGWVTQAKLTASDATADELFGHSVALNLDTVLIGAHQDDDGGANSGSVYVFTRSGTVWTQQAKLTASDGAAYDEFGRSVAVDGDTVLVGASTDDDGGSSSGSAYVFTRSGTVWTEEQKLTASDAAAGDFFGWSVAVDGDTALIGAHYDGDGGSNSGSAYVFTRSGTVWTEEQKLTASDAEASDYFGWSVAVDGDTTLIGARNDDDGGTNSGSAYVFTRAGTVWTEEQKLTASDAAAGDELGYSVAIDGDTALIGAYLDDDGGSNSGSAYVFTRLGTVWTEEQKLTASDAAADDWFGSSVAVDSDIALIGAPYNDDVGASSGSAYVFTRSGTTWTEEQKLTASDAAAGDKFGYSVAIDYDTALIGAQQDDDGASNSGSAYVFIRIGETWAQEAKLIAFDGSENTAFGSSVSLEGNTALVGAIGGTGSAYVFTRSGTIWTHEAKLLASDASNLDYFGWSVALSGNTALVGSWKDDDKGSHSGSAYVFTRSGTTWTQQAKLLAWDGEAEDDFGRSVALDGDTALIGMDGDATNGEHTGAAYVFTRSGTIWTPQAKLLASDGEYLDYFGWSVALDGDIALIGALRGDNNLGIDTGAAYVFTRSGTTWTEQAKLLASDTVQYAYFGRSVALEGDKALVSVDAGSVYIFTRSGANWTEIDKLTASDAEAYDYFGWSVALSGDTALVGAYGDDDGGSDSGSAYFNRFECGFTGPIIANTWTMIGLPCAPDSNADTVGGLFGDTLDVNEYYARWIVHRYNAANDTYEQLQLTDTVSQGEGYWLLSYDDSNWDATGSLTSYPVTQAEGCAVAEGCYAIDLVLPDSATTRYNLVGFPNNIDIDWSQARFLVNDITSYTPSEAETNGIASKTIWKWNGSSYDTYDDTTPGMLGTLGSHEGFWVQMLSGSFSETSVKLLIPAK